MDAANRATCPGYDVVKIARAVGLARAKKSAAQCRARSPASRSAGSCQELEFHERDRDLDVPEPCSAHWRTCQPFLDCGGRHRRSHRQCEEIADKIEAIQNRS